jgi:hypothetical protein
LRGEKKEKGQIKGVVEKVNEVTLESIDNIIDMIKKTDEKLKKTVGQVEKSNII